MFCCCCFDQLFKSCSEAHPLRKHGAGDSKAAQGSREGGERMQHSSWWLGPQLKAGAVCALTSCKLPHSTPSSADTIRLCAGPGAERSPRGYSCHSCGLASQEWHEIFHPAGEAPRMEIHLLLKAGLWSATESCQVTSDKEWAENTNKDVQCQPLFPLMPGNYLRILEQHWKAPLNFSNLTCSFNG